MLTLVTPLVGLAAYREVAGDVDDLVVAVFAATELDHRWFDGTRQRVDRCGRTTGIHLDTAIYLQGEAVGALPGAINKFDAVEIVVKVHRCVRFVMGAAMLVGGEGMLPNDCGNDAFSGALCA